MCVVSMVMDHYNDKFKERYNQYYTYPVYIDPNIYVKKEDFEELKKDFEEMKNLLKRAHEYDINNNQPDCHNDEKVAMLKQFAKALGLDVKDIFKDVEN